MREGSTRDSDAFAQTHRTNVISRVTYRSYLLAYLLLVEAFNSTEGLALGLVLQSIKVEFALSDVHLGLLTGLGFSLFYSVAGIPIARWVDRGNRVIVISSVLIFTSTALALREFVRNFWQLFLTRASAAMGESGCSPFAHSLVADYFSREERPRAVTRFMIGAPIGTLIGYILAGRLSEAFGWRMMFLLIGLPGFMLAILGALTLREPRRAALNVNCGGERQRTRGTAPETAAPFPPLTPGQVVGALVKIRTYRHLLLYSGLVAIFSFGTARWQATFFIRSYGLSTAELGVWLGIAYSVGIVVGILMGGEWATRHAARNERLQLASCAAATAGSGVLAALIYIAPNYPLAFVAIALYAMIAALITAPLFGTIQTLVPDYMRAQAFFYLGVASSLIGGGFGPLLAGGLSDFIRPWFGSESLRYTSIALCPISLLGAWQMWCASRHVSGDLERIGHSSTAG